MLRRLAVEQGFKKCWLGKSPFRHLSTGKRRRKHVSSSSSKKVVYVAIAANLAIATSKYVAAFLTGSSAMMAEAFHTTVDTGNELLLVYGMKRSQRPPDELHPFGHGKAVYFYSLLVAVYIFGIGGGLAILQGIGHLKHPPALDKPLWNYVVLAIALVFDLYSWKISYRELMAGQKPDMTTWRRIKSSKDPTIFTVFLEDSVGIAGTLIAFLGILLGHLLHNPYWDPSASIAIGLMLGGVALFLGRESGALLLGESVDPAKAERLKMAIRSDPAVEGVGDLLTMYLGPEQVLLNVDIKFRSGLTVGELEASIDRLEDRISREHPEIRRIFIEAEALKQEGGTTRKVA
jgi:cation diffusion facilitator family transporter